MVWGHRRRLLRSLLLLLLLVRLVGRRLHAAVLLLLRVAASYYESGVNKRAASNQALASLSFPPSSLVRGGPPRPGRPKHLET